MQWKNSTEFALILVVLTKIVLLFSTTFNYILFYRLTCKFANSSVFPVIQLTTIYTPINSH